MEKVHTRFLRFVSFPKAVCYVIAILIGTTIAAAQNGTTISVASESTVESDRVDLGKIAKVSGDAGRVQRLSAISLGYAPAIGVTREITRDQLKLAINAAGFADGDFTLDSPARALVRRVGQEVADAKIREAVERSVLRQFSTGNVSAQITRLEVPGSVQVPMGNVEIRTNVAAVRSLFERFSIPVEIRVNGKLITSFPATLELTAFADVLVATGDLAINKKILDSDVRLEKVRLEKPILNYLKDKDALRGLQMTRALESGKPLTVDSVAAANVIKYGDLVKIELVSDKIKIIVTGEARAQGKIGDRISVRNTQSGAMLQAVVIGEGLVRLSY
ncbi:hypothetical protein BH10ACI2_BH10ACI2_03500 [soil metagenome]